MSNPISLTITIGDDQFVSERIVEAAAAQLLQTFAGTDEFDDPRFKNSALASMLTKKIDEAVTGYVRDVVERHARETLARGVPRTNVYGDHIGTGTVTVAELIHEKMSRELTEKKGGRDGESVLNRVIREEVDRALSNELHEEVLVAKKHVKNAIAAEAAELLTKAVARQVGA